MKIFSFRDVLPQLPNVFFRRRLRFTFELLPFEAKRLAAKKIGNFFLAWLNQFILPSRPFGFPVIAQVEPANFCNLSCPLCLTASETSSRPKIVLAFDTFKRFIDEVGDYLLLIILWSWGEPFLNPDIFKIIAYAKSKNIIVHTSTNGNVRFDNDKANALVDSGLDSLVFGIDGATQEAYSKYRKGGNLRTALTNIKTIVSIKRRKDSDTPRLTMRFVVMQHNEKELPLVKGLAEELEVDFFAIKTVDMPPACGENLDAAFAPSNAQYKRYEYEPQGFKKKEKPFTCMRPWKRIILDALGEMIPCEYDYRNLHSYGTLNREQSALSIWKGEKAAKFRKKFNLGNNDFYLCKDCTYKDMVPDDCVVERIHLNRTKERN